MLHDGVVGVGDEVVVAEEVVAMLTHGGAVGGEHLIDQSGEVVRVDALAPVAVAVLLRNPAYIRIWVGGADHWYLIFQIGEQTGRVVRDGEAVDEEDEVHVAGLHEQVVVSCRSELKFFETTDHTNLTNLFGFDSKKLKKLYL